MLSRSKPHGFICKTLSSIPSSLPNLTTILTICLVFSRSVVSLESSLTYQESENNENGTIPNLMTLEDDLEDRLSHFPDLSWTSSVDLFNTAVRVPSSSLQTKSSNSSLCLSDLFSVITAVHSHSMPVWLLSLLDSAGKMPSGIEKGAVNWVGDFNQCLQVKRMKDDDWNSTSKDQVRFSGRYCSVYWSVSLSNASTVIPLTQGICVPDSCQSRDMQHHLKNILILLKLDPRIRRLFEKQVKLSGIYCHPLPKERPWNTMAIFTFYVIGGTAAVCVVASLLDLIVNIPMKTSTSKGRGVKRSTLTGRSRLRKSKARGSSSRPDDEECIVQSGDSVVEEVASSSEDDASNPTTSSSTGNPLVLQDSSVILNISERNSFEHQLQDEFFCLPFKLILCFSLLPNTLKLLSTCDKRPTRPQIPCLNGIRVLSMTWVILCHSYLFSLSVTNNLVDLLQDVKDFFAFSVVINGSFSVDSFFVLSALLLSYSFLSPTSRSQDDDDSDDESRPRGGPIRRLFSTTLHLFSLYFYRLLRILPVYLIVLLIDSSVAHLTSSGPFWDYGDQVTSEHTLCRDSWWYNILFINNFLPLKKQCMAWTWYLANDMQFFIVAPFLLLVVKW